MQTKLTLRLDDSLIKRAKEYSQTSGKSLSQIVSDHFGLLTSENEDHYQATAPVTKSLRGILSQNPVNHEDYYRYLEEKHH